MPKLQIPERHQPALARIRDLDPSDVVAIKNALEQLPDSINPAALATAEVRLPASVTDPQLLLEAVVALYVLKSANESVSLQQFVEDICDAMEALKTPARLQESQRPDFREKLLTLFSVEKFALISKGYDLQTDDERTFCDARILTDIRPVFGAQIKEGSQGAVLVHLLKLGYHQGSLRHQKFYVALDSKDLKELRSVIDRAEQKAEALKAQFKDVRFLGLS